MRDLLSEDARRGFDQTKEFLSEKNFSQMTDCFKNSDGTYNVDLAEVKFAQKAESDEAFQERLRKREIQCTIAADKHIKKINDICAETNGTNRPDANVGNGTSEAALRQEVETGSPVGGRGHAEKCSVSIAGLRDAIKQLENEKRFIIDTVKIAEIDTAIAHGHERISSMRPAISTWNTRMTDHPNVWKHDGTSVVCPGFPHNPGLIPD